MQVIYMLFLPILLCSFIFTETTFATKWVHQFVVWDGFVYVVKDEYVKEIDQEIGKVTKYSDMEQYAGNFSNVYKEGTKYYSIKDISTNEYIAIEVESGKYKKAARESEYILADHSSGNMNNGKFNAADKVVNVLFIITLGLFVIGFMVLSKGKLRSIILKKKGRTKP
ncbi:hypothetical protein [Fictibacillus phosphorivorans]|uniref:hypothetical protein n=1 Tax=Fictibacillus phosphorivorans TaxID=1221500 RepID=UPI001885A2EE|nr:hypothetical protein [Fictibacillus phosphorivorans]